MILKKGRRCFLYYLNTDAQITLFQKMLKGEIYVDKSLLIEKVSKVIGTGNQYICITRPRRFGKTINANMLGAYYTKGYDSRTLFEHLAIASVPGYEDHINSHNVIHIDFSVLPDFCRDYEAYLKNIIQKLRDDLSKAYPVIKDKEFMGLNEMLRGTGDSFIFILDEWDSIFYEEFMSTQDKIHFLKFLKALLKDKPYVELAYMTGVLPIVKYSSGSELNMFDEFNFMTDNVYDLYFGFHMEEVKDLCDRFQTISYKEMEYWYDGYYTSQGKSLFNPRSVCKALSRGICLNYWTETGPMNEIADCIEHNIDEVREDIVEMVSGIPVEEELSGYSVLEQQLDNRDEILSAMVVYGFLSYHDGYLRIPNHELMEKYHKVLSRDSMGDVKKIVDSSKDMLEATLAMDAEKVTDIIEAVHDREIPFLKYNDENALSCVITLCYLYARKDYRIEREEKSGKGFCDYLFYPKKAGKPAIILELKVGCPAEEAIMQIKNRDYLQKVRDNHEILLVGISYDKDDMAHRCIIEKV